MGDLMGDLSGDILDDFGPGIGGRCFANILLVDEESGKPEDEPPVGRGLLTSPEGSGLRGGFAPFASFTGPEGFGSLGAAEGNAVLPKMPEEVGVAEALFDVGVGVWPRITASRFGLEVLRVTMRRFFGEAVGILSRFDGGSASTLGLFEDGMLSFSGRGRLARMPD